MSHSSERKALIAELEENRARITGDLAELSESANLTHRFQDSVRQHPAWWIGGGLVGGIIVSQLLASRGSRQRENGKSSKGSLFLGLLGFAAKEILRISTPALKQAAGQQLEQWIKESHPQPAGDTENDSFPNQDTN